VIAVMQKFTLVAKIFVCCFALRRFNLFQRRTVEIVGFIFLIIEAIAFCVYFTKNTLQICGT